MTHDLAVAGTIVVLALALFAIGRTINAALPRIMSALRGEGGWE